MGQIKRSSVTVSSLSARLCVCLRSHGRIFWLILTKFGTDVWSMKRRNPFVGIKINPMRAPPIFTNFTPKWHPIMHFQWESWNTSLASLVSQSVH